MLLPYFSSDLIEAGCDEAGRGCLAGPVFAAAVILPKDYSNHKLNDSKKLTEKQRNLLRIEIEKDAVDFAVENLTNNVIDEINILNASFEAMQNAVCKLKTKAELLLIDGNRFKNRVNIPHKCIIKGDGIYMSIAAASILAKTYRDEYMNEIDNEFPKYGWKKNKGYPTIFHKKAILQNGITHYHRKTYVPCMLKLF
jgi:ribonuclease HII